MVYYVVLEYHEFGAETINALPAEIPTDQSELKSKSPRMDRNSEVVPYALYTTIKDAVRACIEHLYNEHIEIKESMDVLERKLMNERYIQPFGPHDSRYEVVKFEVHEMYKEHTTRKTKRSSPTPAGPAKRMKFTQQTLKLFLK